MSFNTKNENKSIPLIDEKIQDTFNKLQTEYINFIKVNDEIYNYDQKLVNLSRKEYDKIKDDM